MDVERILVFFESPDGCNLWRAVAREDIPDWLRSPAIIDRMLAGEMARRAEDSPGRFFKVVEVDRPRPAGQHQLKARAEIAAEDQRNGIILPSALN